jgi:hypothetical protein
MYFHQSTVDHLRMLRYNKMQPELWFPTLSFFAMYAMHELHRFRGMVAFGIIYISRLYLVDLRYVSFQRYIGCPQLANSGTKFVIGKRAN